MKTKPPATPLASTRKRKANVKQLQTQQQPSAMPAIPCTVHQEFKLTWFGITLTKITKPLA